MSFSKLKNTLAKKLNRIEPTLGFVRSAMTEITDLREKPNMFDYIGLGLSLREHYLDYFGQPVVEYFNSCDWDSFRHYWMEDTITKYFSESYEVNEIAVKNKITRQVTIDGIKFGWISDTENETYNLFVSKGKAEQAKQIIYSMLWNKYKDSCMVVGVEEGPSRFVFLDDITPKLVKSAAGKKITERIARYLKEGKKRSILFYGPPGTGKSNLIKGIAHSLELKTLRFEDFEHMADIMGSTNIINIVNLLNPDLIVIEDIDHNFTDYSRLLDKMESFHAAGKMVFVTANKASVLDDALLRAGRINETIEIKRLDEEVIRELVKNDEEIFEVVRDFPASFIVEVMERVEVLGKEEALSSISDIKQRLRKMDNSNYELVSDESEDILE